MVSRLPLAPSLCAGLALSTAPRAACNGSDRPTEVSSPAPFERREPRPAASPPAQASKRAPAANPDSPSSARPAAQADGSPAQARTPGDGGAIRLSGAQIRPGLRLQRLAATSCFEGVAPDAALSLNVEITPDGEVGRVQVLANRGAPEHVVSCVKREVRRVRFARASESTYYQATFSQNVPEP